MNTSSNQKKTNQELLNDLKSFRKVARLARELRQMKLPPATRARLLGEACAAAQRH